MPIQPRCSPLLSAVTLCMLGPVSARAQKPLLGLPFGEEVALCVADLAAATVRDTAVDRLLELGAVAVPALLRAIAESRLRGLTPVDPADPQVLSTLARIGPEATAALPQLRFWAKGPVHPKLRPGLLQALGAIGPFDPNGPGASLQALDEFRRHNGPCCSPEFIRAVSRLHLDPNQTLREQVGGLADGNVFVREFCAELIGRRGRAAHSARFALAAALDQEHPGEVELRGLGWSAAVLGRFDRRIHRQLAASLIAVAPESLEALPAWSRRLSAARLEHRVEAAMALGQLGPEGAAAVPALCLALADSELRVVRYAVTSLGQIGPAAHAARDLLRGLTDDSDPEIAARAQAALHSIR